MLKVRDFFHRLRFQSLRARFTPPVIQSPWGQVTESARLQAAMNMRNSPEVKERVIGFLESEGRSRQEAERTARERYPEAF